TRRDPEWKERVYHQKWYPGETPSLGIGQGALQVNPLQLCVMCSRIANGNIAVHPRLVKSIGGKELPRGNQQPPLNASAEHLEFVRKAMLGVTTEGGGTANGKLDISLGDIKVAGKTGTAQAHGYGGGRGSHGAQGTWESRDHGWFIAFAPADDPMYAMAVLVEHGGFGATASAPKVREIMREALIKD